MKKLISLLMALVMVFSMAPAVFAEEDGSVVLLDETAVIEDSWGADYYLTAPGDGNITITFDDTTGYDIEYQVLINEIDANRKYSYEDGYTYTWMVSEGDSIYLNICLMSEGSYVAGNIDFTFVYTTVAASTETETITGTVTFEDSDSAYNGKTISYTAPTTGTLTLNLIPYDDIDVEWKIEVNGNARWFDTPSGSSTTQSAELVRGDLVEIFIATADGYNSDGWLNYAPGTVDYELIFTPSAEGDGGDDEIDTVLELGDNELSLAAGESYSASYYFTAEEDGLLTLDVAGLIMHSPFEGTMDVSEYPEDYIGGALYIYVNGNYYEEPISVTAGETVEIYLFQNRMYSNYGYAWDMLLNLSMGGGNEGGIVEIGEVTFFIDEGQESSEVYTFTPEQDGLLSFDFIEVSSYSAANGDEIHTEYVEEMLGGTIYVYVNGESYIGDPISVTAGVPVEIYMSQAPMYVNHGYSWYAAVSLSLSVSGGGNNVNLGEATFFIDEGHESSEIYTFTPEQDGLLSIDFIEVSSYSAANGDEIHTEYVEEMLGGTIYVYVNGESYIGDPISVTAGVPVEIYMTQAPMYVNSGYSWYAAVSLSLSVSGGGEEEEIDPTLYLGDNSISIAPGEESSIIYNYVPVEDGLLDFNITALVAESAFEIVDLTEFIDEYLGRDVYLFVNGEPYTDPVEVTAGEPVEVFLLQEYVYASDGYGWNALLNISVYEDLGPGSTEPETVTGSITTTDANDAYLGHEVYYTAPGDGTVVITLTSEDTEIEYNINYNDDGGNWFNTVNGDSNVQTYEVSNGDTFAVLICTLEALESYVPGT
ncbi:MAG: hypothetical protein IJ306_08420, partial [Oscillospiraceae bacterium]|nr:hypothetical protein [Oscillospiraceae bacterium]